MQSSNYLTCSNYNGAPIWQPILSGKLEKLRLQSINLDKKKFLIILFSSEII